MIRNSHWYNMNQLRAYPVDESATVTDDEGTLLPSAILADLNLKFPRTAGKFAFISSVTVTERLATVTIQAADELDEDVGFIPLAVVTQTVPFQTGIPFTLEPQYPGVGGWVVFGEGLACPYRGRFSTAQQSVLAYRAAKPYSPLPVTSLSKLANNRKLSGVITLLGQSPVQVVAESRDILGEERDVIVVRLVQPPSGENVFDLYSGPCASRPETGTCGDPEPVELLNTVAPNCDGNICIEFRGCGEISQLVSPCGVVIDCDLGLSDACTRQDRLPDADGRLPNEYDDLCFVAEAASEFSSISESIGSEESISELPADSDDLCSYPHSDDFGDSMADDFTVINGEFIFVDEEVEESGESATASDVYYATQGDSSASLRNIAIWDCIGTTTGKRVTVTGKMETGPVGSLHNMGVIINYRDHVTIPERVEYYLMDYDFNTATFRLLRFNGTIFQNLVSAVVSGVGIDEMIELEARIVDGPGEGQVSITIELTGIDNPAAATLGPVVTNTYLPDDGKFGLHALRSHTKFKSFEVAEYP